MRNKTGIPAGVMLVALAAMPAFGHAEVRGAQLQVRLTLQDRCEIDRNADNATVARCSAGVSPMQRQLAAPVDEQARSSLPLPRKSGGGPKIAFVF